MPGDGLRIEAMAPAHAAGVLAVYQAGIDTGNATFETSAGSWADFSAKWRLDLRVVAVGERGQVAGWAAAGSVSNRSVYAGVAQHSLYVDPAWQGQGLGGRLLDALIGISEAAGVWTLQSGIFPENVVSLAVHRRHGFREVGVRSRVGWHHDRWRDVVLVERRSSRVGA